ncbi:hypothetical protein B0H19DRAFT_1244273 [Mycena capillaripes]|nr:hypothetical protein B0H19DRAFT_1244273 [Mycena capillaripes]
MTRGVHGNAVPGKRRSISTVKGADAQRMLQEWKERHPANSPKRCNGAIRVGGARTEYNAPPRRIPNGCTLKPATALDINNVGAGYYSDLDIGRESVQLERECRQGKIEDGHTRDETSTKRYVLMRTLHVRRLRDRRVSTARAGGRSGVAISIHDGNPELPQDVPNQKVQGNANKKKGEVKRSCAAGTSLIAHTVVIDWSARRLDPATWRTMREFTQHCSMGDVSQRGKDEKGD